MGVVVMGVTAEVVMVIAVVTVMLMVGTATSVAFGMGNSAVLALETPKTGFVNCQHCQRYFLIIYITRISNIDIIKENLLEKWVDTVDVLTSA